MPDGATRVGADDAAWPQLQQRGGRTLTIAEAAAALKRSFWTIVVCVAAAVAIAVWYAATTPPGYVATAQLMIEPAKQQLAMPDSNLVDSTVDNAQVESQVEVLRSENIANDVIATLKLANDPEFRSREAVSDYVRDRIAVARFKDALSTRRVGQSYVIEVSFRSADPDKAARIANAIAAAYIRDELRAKTEVARQASQWMQERVTELGVELNNAAAAVQKFRAANGIIDNGTNNNSQLRLIDKLTELEARAEAYRKLYESFVQRLTENRQQQSYPVSNARVIAPASAPLVKAYPKTKLILLLAILLGVLAGAAIAAARAMLDGSVRHPRQIREELGLDPLASLPALQEASRNGGKHPYDQLLTAPDEPFAQGVRSLKLSLLNVLPHDKSLRLGVVSLRPGEGKTTVAISVATAFARSGAKVLLIDGNLRNPALSRHLLPGARRGIAAAVEGELDAAAALDPHTMAYILPAVPGEAADAADLLSAERMRPLLQQTGRAFAVTIIDLPSLEAAVDARAVGPLLDGCIVVVQWGATPLDALAEAVDRLRAGHVRLLGVVINKVEDGFPGVPGWARAAFDLVSSAAGYRTKPIAAGS